MTSTAIQEKQRIAERFAQLEPEKRRAFLETLQTKGIDFSRLPIPVSGRGQKSFPLSYAQQRLWFLSRFDSASSVYHMPGAFRLRGAFERDLLERSLARMMERHEVLRTTYREGEDGTAEQVVQDSMAVPMTVMDLSMVPVEEREQRARDLATEIVSEAFALEKAPPFRCSLLKLEENDQILVVTLHHIAADGASIPLLMGELKQIYEALLQNQEPLLPALPIQYADYALWQRNWLEAGERERQLAFWRAQLSDPDEVLNLPTDRPRPATPSHRGDEQSFVLTAALSEQLRALAQRKGCTLFMVLLAAFNLILYRYSGQSDLRVGVPVANRQRLETERLLGCFVNTMVLRTLVDGAQTFDDLLTAVKNSVVAAQDHQDLPFESLIEALQPERSLSQNPLFQVMFDHGQRREQAFKRFAELTVESFDLPVGTAKFDLSLSTTEEHSGAITGRIAYAADLFDQSSIRRFQAHLEAILRQIALGANKRLSEFELLSLEELEDLTVWSRDETADEMAEGDELLPVHALIEKHAKANPDKIAIVFNDETLSFGALNRRANRLAHRLLALGLLPEDRVGISMRRSPESVVTFLAVFKAGAAYVPLDPDYPPDRLRVIQEDAGLSLVISHSEVEAVSSLEDRCPILLLDQEDLSEQAETDPCRPVKLQNLAYIIYTSGSTGRPKGVAVEHGPLAMHCLATGRRYDITADSRELHFLSFTFDGAHERWLVPFCFGASIVLRDDTLWSAEQTYETIRKQGVTHAGFPPKYIQQLADWAAQAGDPPEVWLYSFGGEAMSKAGLEKVQKALKPQRVINGYGPTETVISPVVWKGTADSGIDTPYVPIGRPVGDRRAYVLDGNLMPVPQGHPGELCLGGSGLARGYHGQPGLTAASFVPDPFGEPGSRIYLTGDRVCWRDGGVIDFIGRADHQVKVRGFRVELGDIEAHLIAMPDVRTAVVVPHSSGGHTRLVGYVVAEKEASLDTRDLSEGLAKALPEYMVPASLILIDALPVNSNGKLNHKALPEPDWNTGKVYIAPRDASEVALARVWQDVLGREQIGVKDNFFELGGDSILSLQIVARARQLGLRLTPKQLFEKQTIEELAEVAERVDPQGGGSGSGLLFDDGDVPPSGQLPLTPIQTAFFEEAIPGRNRWNQSVLLRSAGAVEFALLSKAIAALVSHHDALRLRFQRAADGSWRQVYSNDPGDAPLWERHLDGGGHLDSQIEEFCNEAQCSLDIEKGPLIRGLLLHLPDQSQRLLMVAHHLVVDGVSWRILLEDLQSFYTRIMQGSAPVLSAKTASYGLWARSLEAYAESAQAKNEMGYWRACLSGIEPLPYDNPQGENRQRHARTVSLQLDRKRTGQLLKEAPAAYRTQINDLLLTALSLAVGAWCQREAFLVHLEGHGREDLFDGLDVSRTTGWFTSVFPVRLSRPGGDLGAAIKQTKETLRRVPARGIGYGLLRYLGGPEARAALATEEVSLAFNYLGQFGGRSEAALWQPAEESSGSGKDLDAPLGSRLTINGQVMDGALSLHCQFSEDVYRPATVESLMGHLREALSAVIDHCIAQDAGQVSPSDFPLASLTQEQLDHLPVSGPEIEDIYPLSAMQRGMLLHGIQNPASDAYMVQVQATITGVEVDRLKAAWQTVLARHAILRTSFAWHCELSEPLQIVRKAATIPVREFDWRDASDQDGDWDVLCDREFRTHFDLATAPLLRMLLVRTHQSTYRFAATWHHALLDGWSMSQLLGEVLRVYDREPVPAGVGRYRDYIAWTRQRSDSSSEAFWNARLDKLKAPTLLSRALKAEKGRSGQTACERTLDEAKVSHLTQFAGAEKVTLNTLVQAAWILLLQHYTGQATVAFGATVSGRSADLPDIERIMGLLVGTLPVVQNPRPDETVGVWLRALQADNLSLREHEHAPPQALQCWGLSTGQSDKEKAAPFDTVLIFENYPVDEALRQTVRGAVSFSDVGNRGQTSYPLTAVIIPRDTLTLRLEFSRAVLDERGVEDLVSNFESLVMRLSSDRDSPLRDVVTDALSHREAPPGSPIPGNASHAEIA